MNADQNYVQNDFLDLLPEIVFEIDKDLRIKFLNKSSQKILGYDNEELIGKTISLEKFVNPGDINRLKENIIKNFNGEHNSGGIYRIINQNNKELSIQIFNNPVKNNGKVGSLRCIAIDVTKKERSIKNITNKVENYRLIYQNSPIAYQSLDSNGNFIEINPAWEKITGYKRKEIISKNFKSILTKEYASKFEKAFKIFKEKGEVNDVQFNIITKDNRVIYVSYNGKIEYLPNGEFLRSHCVFNDITLQKKAEQTLIDSELKLRELNATKDKFFSIIAHDLKNPFNDLIGFTQLLALNIDKYDKKRIEKFTQIIHQSSKLAYNLLENLLDWSRAQTGTLNYNPEKILINNIIDENVSLLESTANNKNLKIYSELDNLVYVYADKNMVRTIIRNLISNAIKYTNQGGFIKIQNYCNKKMCEISISDNGIGISEENLDKIFKIDESFSTIGTEREKGTGLGLILCNEFIEKNGGELWVKSEPDKGSTFSFTLPLPEPEFIS